MLSIPAGLNEKEAKQWYRSQLRKTHPDSGGSNEAFAELQRVWDLYLNPPLAVTQPRKFTLKHVALFHLAVEEQI